MLKLVLINFLIFGFLQELNMKRKNLTDFVSMEVPAELRTMTQQELSAKFLGARIPAVAMTDEQSAVEFTITASPTFWLEKDVPLLKDFYDASVPNLFEKIDFSKKELMTINGKQFAAYQFTGTPSAENANRLPEERFTYLLYTLHKNGLVVISFSCPPYLREKWKPISEAMFQSIKFR